MSYTATPLHNNIVKINTILYNITTLFIKNYNYSTYFYYKGLVVDDLFQSNKSWQLLAKGRKSARNSTRGVVYIPVVENMIKIDEIIQTVT